MGYQKQSVRPRVKQVLLMLAKGHQEPYIAYRFGLSLSTITSYVTDARQYYHLGGTPREMAEEALNRGLISRQELEEA